MQKLCGYRVRRLFTDRPNPTFNVKPWTKIINWGNSHTILMRDGEHPAIVNKFGAVRGASNKLITFQKLKDVDGIRIPEFTTERDVAAEWIANKNIVVCRTTLTGHSGRGIVLCGGDLPDKLVNAPLYVKYVKKQKEFRVHVVFGEVIDVQEKRKRRELPEDFSTNFQVRNHQTGWVYCREDIVVPDGMLQMGVQVVRELGLEFGAVDIIWNEKSNTCYCLEVNTAPGLEGTTVTKYAEAFWKGLKS